MYLWCIYCRQYWSLWASGEGVIINPKILMRKTRLRNIEVPWLNNLGNKPWTELSDLRFPAESGLWTKSAWGPQDPTELSANFLIRQGEVKILWTKNHRPWENKNLRPRASAFKNGGPSFHALSQGMWGQYGWDWTQWARLGAVCPWEAGSAVDGLLGSLITEKDPQRACWGQSTHV